MSSTRVSQSAIVAPHAKASLILLPLLLYAFWPTRSASAQVTPTEDGTQSIVNVVDSELNITGGQRSEDGANLFHSFEQFNVDTEQTANFVTVPEIRNVVGTVGGNQASVIDGTLQVSGSDASLYLINPAGVLLGPNARLNLTGGFSATTATGIEFGEEQLSADGRGDYAKLIGDPSAFRFDSEQLGAVVNLGDLGVDDGEAIALIGGTVVNAGSLRAPQGTVTIAAVEGGNVIRINQGDRLLSLEVEASSELLRGEETISPASIGGMLTGEEISRGSRLVTNADGTVQIVGSEVAIAQGQGEGQGQAIATGLLSTSSSSMTGGIGGNINVLGENVSLVGAQLEASGTSGGGLIRVGGDYKGEGTLFNASHTSIDSDSVVLANAVETGDGGRIIIWADETTHYEGALSARGGATSGNGGFAEISGKVGLTATGSIDLSASEGDFGTVLFDPKNITITDEIPTPLDFNDNMFLSSNQVEEWAGGADVIFEASNDIIIKPIDDGAITFAPGRSVTFRADTDNRNGGEFRMENVTDSIELTEGNISIFGAGVTVGNLSIDPNYQENEANSASVGNITIESSDWLSAANITSERGNVSLSGNDITAGTINTSSDARNLDNNATAKR